LDEWGKRVIRNPIKGKYGEPQHWDGLSALFIVLAHRDHYADYLTYWPTVYHSN
jgi:hypothetical protein